MTLRLFYTVVTQHLFLVSYAGPEFKIKLSFSLMAFLYNTKNAANMQEFKIQRRICLIFQVVKQVMGRAVLYKRLSC